MTLELEESSVLVETSCITVSSLALWQRATKMGAHKTYNGSILLKMPAWM